MAIYKYIRETWNNPSEEAAEKQRERLLKWRREPVTVRIEKPTRLDRARAIGYKAKTGFIMVRQRVDRGGRQRPDIKGARRSKHSGQRKDLKISYQQVAEERVARKFPNLEVLNSYFAAKDGPYYWYEVLLADRASPVVAADKRIAWISAKQHRKRAFRGITSAARKSRGLRHKGKGAEKLRPSLRAHQRLGK
ncbi:50S ribosomal protein L15e [Candidatus Woesearchaeota archaeon]|nr:50S ribosomal protein L15e [Candidatus Woesearchaeota archaeon]